MLAACLPDAFQMDRDALDVETAGAVMVCRPGRLPAQYQPVTPGFASGVLPTQGNGPPGPQPPTPKARMRFDLVTLQLLLAVERHGSITRAADEQHIALAAASTRIKDLEDRAGVQLLERHARGVTFTAAGKALVHRARAIERELDALSVELEEYARGISGHVRIAANASSIASCLPADLTAFLRTTPKVKIDLSEHTSRDVQRLVLDSAADIGVYAGRNEFPALVVFTYREDSMVVLTPRRAPFTRIEAMPLDNLIDQDLIMLQEGGSIQDILGREAARYGRPLKIRIRVKGFDAICQMVAADLGVAVLPAVVAERFARTHDLRLLPIAGFDAARELKICVRDAGALPGAARSLLGFLLTGRDAAAAGVKPSPAA